MITVEAALDRLREGNRRYAADAPRSIFLTDRTRRSRLAVAQEPFAIVLGCSDSRVPAEIVFDQGVGDLFVIRVAGNIVAPSQVGSVEFAADRFGTPLVVVLGHSRCGAVVATLEELQRPTGGQSPNLRSIVDRIRPAVEGLLDRRRQHQDDLLQKAVRANVRASVRQLRSGSDIIEGLVSSRRLLIVGAEYSLDTGIVEFFDDRTEPALQGR